VAIYEHGAGMPASLWLMFIAVGDNERRMGFETDQNQII
jgi:NADPH-dependent ferric siderophore reductase